MPNGLVFPPRRHSRGNRPMTEAQRLASCRRLAAHMTSGRDYSGLHQGEVLNRWLRHQPGIDRALFWVAAFAIYLGMGALAALVVAQ